MLRALWLFLLITVIAVAASFVADIEGTVTIALADHEIRLGIPVAVTLVILLSIFTIIMWRIITAFVDAPAEFFRWRAMGRRRRGFAAVTRGLVAVAAGDEEEARRQSRKAISLVGEPPLAVLLAAQAAQIDGDEETAQRYYTQMLQSKDTEFLGLRGLFMTAMRRDDTAQAVVIAQRAAALRPKTRWALNALFELNVARRDWKAAASAVEAQQKAKHLDVSVAKRRRAVLAAAIARETDSNGEFEEAARAADEALVLSPGFSVPALIAARHALAQGRQWRAASVLEAAWSQEPNPELARAYANLKPDETSANRARRLAGLSGMNAQHPESLVLATAVSMSQGRYEEAREKLRPLAERLPTVRVCLLMADLERSIGGESIAARDWSNRALRAPRDAQWTCSACGHALADWTPTCSSCDGFDTLAWQSGSRGTVTEMRASEASPAWDEATETGVFLYRDTVKDSPQRHARQPVDVAPKRDISPDADEPVVFGPPRAPDDPGPDAEDFTQAGDDKRRKGSGLW